MPLPVVTVGAMRRVPITLVSDMLGLLHALTFDLGEDGQHCMADLIGNRYVAVPRAWPELRRFLRRDARYVTASTVLAVPHVDYGEPTGTLGPNTFIRYDQRPAWLALSSEPVSPWGRVLVLGCGKGKTILALRLIAARQRKAVVVCHTINMLRKWQQECRNLLPAGDYTIGTIGDGENDWDKDLVFTTMPGLIRRKYPAHFWQRMAVFDEGDLLGASKLSQILPMFTGERVLVTATPTRADGRAFLYDNHVGPRCYEDIRPDLTPKCYILDSPVAAYEHIPVDVKARGKVVRTEIRRVCMQGTAWSRYTGRPAPNIPRTLNNLEKVTKRTAWILGVVEDLVLNHQRKVLFLGERIAGLQHMHRAFTEMVSHRWAPFLESRAEAEQLEMALSGLALGKKHMKPAEIDHNLRTCRVIWGITQIAQRGLDQADIDTVIIQYASYLDANRLQQTVGRGLRYRDGKPEPLVIVLNDANVPILNHKAEALCAQLRHRWRYDVTWEAWS